MSSSNELACVYAALILADDQVAVTADKLQTILKAANCVVEPYWPALFARALEGVDIRSLLTQVGSMAASPSAAAPAAVSTAGGGAAAPAAAAAKEKVEEKKKEESDESDDDMGFGLFD